VAATDTLLAGYDALAAQPQLAPLRADLVKHRAALAEGVPSASPSASTSASASASASPLASVAVLAAAERQTAGARLADLDAASPALAKLLAAVSASGALHAATLGDSGAITAPSPSAAPSPTPAPDALQAAVAGEHAAVYGYAAICAYAAHEARRDTWQHLLNTTGATPAAAAPGYQLPFPVTDAPSATRLAATLETRLTTVYATLVAGTTGPLRLQAATALREAALAAKHWGATVPALPGIQL
jgi:hypothetical protein